MHGANDAEKLQTWLSWTSPCTRTRLHTGTQDWPVRYIDVSIRNHDTASTSRSTMHTQSNTPLLAGQHPILQ